MRRFDRNVRNVDSSAAELNPAFLEPQQNVVVTIRNVLAHIVRSADCLPK